MTKPPLSVIVAAHNEQGNIPILLEHFAKAHAKLPFELIIVNDGSTDNTEKVTKSELKKKRYSFVRLISYPKNKGYGGAIITGLKTAKADILAWTHADLQTDPLDVVSACRKFIQAPLEHKIIKGRRINRPLGPTLFTFFMSLIASLVFGRAIFDINAQPKLFDRRFYEKLTNPPIDFSLDLYLLVMAKKLGYSILTVPVRFGTRIHGQSKWAFSFHSRIKTIWRTIKYILGLKKDLSKQSGKS